MIDKATVDLIIDTADIVDVVSDFVTLRRRGVNYVGLCPFHNDRTPSFYVSKSKGICKCFSCGEGGSALNFIMKHEQMSYHDALIYLANKYHIEVKEKELTDEERAEQTARDAMFMLNEWAATFFEKQLHDTTEGNEIGLSYFKERGFSPETIKKFRLGYSPEDRSALYKAATEQGFNRQLLFDTGLCVDDNHGGGYDRYRGRVIFPIINVAGKIVAFGGRTLKKEKTIAKYVNSPESIIYSKRKEIYGLFQAKRTITKNDKCFIVEGYADVISMHQSGFENVIASSGTALTDEQIHYIHRFTENVTEMFDGDQAGINAAMKGIDKILAQGLNMKVLILPDDDDPDSYSRKHGASEIQSFIDNNEQDFITFKTGILLKDAERDPIKCSKAIEEVTKSIAVIPSEVTRAIYAKECSDMFNIAEDVIIRDIRKYILLNKEEKAKQRERDKIKQENSVSPQPNDTDSLPTEPVPTVKPAHDSHLVSTTTSAQNILKSVAYAEEEAIIKLVVRYGMCDLCFNVDDENNSTLKIIVTEYLYNEMSADYLTFQNPVFNNIFNTAVNLLNDFKTDLQDFSVKIHNMAKVEFEQKIALIDPLGQTSESIKKNEENIQNEINANLNKSISDFRIQYLRKKLCSHPDDDIRNTASNLVSELYTLSKIHTEFATIPTDYDRLESLVPTALYNWKNAIVGLQIKELQMQMQKDNGENAISILSQLQNLYNVRSDLSKLIGNRVITPN